MEGAKDGEERRRQVTAAAKGPRLPPEVERIGAQVVDSAYTVHCALGPGLLESVYGACLAHELTRRGLSVRTQVAMPVAYEGVTIETGFRLDLLVDHCAIVEVKAVEMLAAVHTAQLRTYLKLAALPLGFLIDLNVARVKDGIRRVTVAAT
jgi:GxxExxY protein